MKRIFWIITSLAVVGLAAFGFWEVFYFQGNANDSLIIELRRNYQEAYWRAASLGRKTEKYPPTGPIYRIEPQLRLAEGPYRYTFMGTFSKIDPDNSLLYLNGAKGKEYVFKTSGNLYSADDVWIKIMKVPDLETLSKSEIFDEKGPLDPNKTYLTSFNEVAVNPIEKTLKYVPPWIIVRWDDERTLVQIETDKKRDPNEALNKSKPETTIFAQFE